MRPKKRILCVDDNEQVLSVRQFMLETRGYFVESVATGMDALLLLESSSFDLLLTDLVMPEMDGDELARRAKLLRPGIPVMMVSGSINNYERGGRADVFLPKGAASAAEVLERVRVLVARKRGPKKKPAAGEYSLPALEAVAV